MVNTLKVKTWIRLESAMPATDRPVRWVKGKWNKMLCVHFTMLTLVHSCHALLLY